LFKRVRPLDAAIILAVVAIFAVGGYLGYVVWANNQSLMVGSPANREIEAFTQKLKLNPNDIETRMRLAQALSVAGRGQEAISQYQQVLKVSKDWVPALSGIGFEMMKRKDWKGGEEYFKKVISLTEDKAPPISGASSLEIAYYYTGVALMEQGDYQGAAGYLRRALALRADASDTSYALAVCYHKLGIPDGYRQMLLYTLQFDPKMPEANYDYGMLLLADGDKAGAAEHFRTSTNAAPYKAEPKDQLAKLGSAPALLATANQLASTDASASLSDARIASALDPKSVESFLLVGKLWEKLKNPTKASEAYQKVIELDPSNAAAAAGLKRVKNGS
jgi:tetratricopeptide (TPR) repeat protein